MRPLDLEEFAQSLYVGQDRDKADFGDAILCLLATEWMGDSYREFVNEMEKLNDKKFEDAENWRHLEIFENQKSALDEIETSLKAAEFEGDIPAMVDEALANLLECQAELISLREELAELKTPKLEWDL